MSQDIFKCEEKEQGVCSWNLVSRGQANGQPPTARRTRTIWSQMPLTLLFYLLMQISHSQSVLASVHGGRKDGVPPVTLIQCTWVEPSVYVYLCARLSVNLLTKRCFVLCMTWFFLHVLCSGRQRKERSLERFGCWNQTWYPNNYKDHIYKDQLWLFICKFLSFLKWYKPGICRIEK